MLICSLVSGVMFTCSNKSVCMHHRAGCRVYVLVMMVVVITEIIQRMGMFILKVSRILVNRRV